MPLCVRFLKCIHLVLSDIKTLNIQLTLVTTFDDCTKIIIIKADELILAPLVGHPVAIPSNEIQSVREAGNMFGKGFILETNFCNFSVRGQLPCY